MLKSRCSIGSSGGPFIWKLTTDIFLQTARDQIPANSKPVPMIWFFWLKDNLILPLKGKNGIDDCRILEKKTAGVEISTDKIKERLWDLCPLNNKNIYNTDLDNKFTDYRLPICKKFGRLNTDLGNLYSVDWLSKSVFLNMGRRKFRGH